MTEMKDSFTEKREDSRAVIKIEIEFTKDIDFVTAYMLNISKGGLFVRTDNAYPLDTIIFLRFTMPGDTQPIETEGKVVWCNNNKRKGYFPRGMGIKFLTLEPDDAEKIKKFVHEHFAQIQHHSII
jgi:uncharacterized protein (TIGR02266 family)